MSVVHVFGIFRADEDALREQKKKKMLKKKQRAKVRGHVKNGAQTLDIFFSIVMSRGRRGGLMVSALDSGSGGPGSSPGRGTALCSWARYFTLIVPLSTQVYKWVPANLLLGVTLRWTSIPSRGE